MKYKVGDEIVLSYKVLECDERFGLYRISENGYLSDDHIEKYAAAYAAKAAPSTAWEPKPGDRVLVEATYSCDDEYGNSVVEIPYSRNGKDGVFPARPVMRSAIVGPAPKLDKPRFRQDDRTFSITENDFVDVQYEAEGGWYVIDANGDMVYATDSDLLTVCELRERLAK